MLLRGLSQGHRRLLFAAAAGAVGATAVYAKTQARDDVPLVAPPAYMTRHRDTLLSLLPVSLVSTVHAERGDAAMLFSADQLSAMASRISDVVDIPLLPPSAERYVLVKALEAIASTISNDIPDRLRAELRHAMSNSLTDEERADLVKKLASFVDSKINLPYLNESEEQLLFQQVISALLSLATPSADGKLVHFHAATLMNGAAGAVHVLLVPEQRHQLAKFITEHCDLPFINQAQEQALVESVIENLSQRVNGLLPPDFVTTLRGSNPKEIEKLKQRIVQRLNETARFTGLSADMREMLLDKVVSVMLEGVASSAGPAFLQDPVTRLAKARETEEHLHTELADFEAHSAARLKQLREQLVTVKTERWQLQKETNWFYHFVGWVFWFL